MSANDPKRTWLPLMLGSSMSTSVRERLSRRCAMSVPRAKTITTYFYPVGDDFRTVVEEWIIFLQPYLDSRRHYAPSHQALHELQCPRARRFMRLPCQVRWRQIR